MELSESGVGGSWVGVKRSTLVTALAFHGPQRSSENNIQGQNTEGKIKDRVTGCTVQVITHLLLQRKPRVIALQETGLGWDTHLKPPKKQKAHRNPRSYFLKPKGAEERATTICVLLVMQQETETLPMLKETRRTGQQLQNTIPGHSRDTCLPRSRFSPGASFSRSLS